MGVTRRRCRDHPESVQYIYGKFCMECGRPLEALEVKACAQCGNIRLGKCCPWCGHQHDNFEAKLEQTTRTEQQK